MSYPSRPNWDWRRDRRVYGVVFFEHLPIHTQTIGANASGVWEASYSWEGGSGANFFDEPRQHHHSFGLYFN